MTVGRAIELLSERDLDDELQISIRRKDYRGCRPHSIDAMSWDCDGLVWFEHDTSLEMK